MKQFFLLLVLLLPFTAISQAEKPRKAIRAIGIVFAPGYSYRTLHYASSNQWIANARDEELGNVAFTAGINLQFRSRRKLGFETGLLYLNQSLKTPFKDLTWVSDVQDLPMQSKTIYRFKYFAVPLSISYNLFKNTKMRFFAKAGLSAMVFLSRKTTVVTKFAPVGRGDEHEHASSKQVGNLRFGVDASTSLGVEYKLSSKIILRAEPFYQRFLTSIVADKRAKEYLFSFGVGIGVNYLF